LVAAGTEPLGLHSLRAQHPHHRPDKPKKAWAPPFHAATKAPRKALLEAYGWYLAYYRDASERLGKGDRSVCFPEGSFPLPLPFVGSEPALAPG
jgi:hypothetical protein